MKIEDAIVEAFELLENKYQPCWRTGKGSKENLMKGFINTEVPIHIALGYSGADGLRHAMNRSMPNHDKPTSMEWRTWLLLNIGKYLCSTCLQVKSLETKVNSTKSRNLCKACDSSVTGSRREVIQEYLYYYLKNSRGCENCGNTNPIVLDFDHIDPATKSFNIGNSYCKPLDIVKAEVLKCRILCANCHRIKTAKDMGYYKYIVSQ